MKILFKNGKELEVSKEDANSIKQGADQGITRFLTIWENGKIKLIINLQEITCIYK